MNTIPRTREIQVAILVPYGDSNTISATWLTNVRHVYLQRSGAVQIQRVIRIGNILDIGPPIEDCSS